MEANNICEYLKWDSDFFSRRIARITANRLSKEMLESIMTWNKINAIDCLYFRCNVADLDSIRLAEDNQFRLVDIRVIFEKRLDNHMIVGDQGMRGVVRPCRPDDIPALRAIAGVSYHDSRFYSDPNFPTALCNTMYETWIEKSCNGYADAVLVAELQGQPVGYISCHLPDRTEGHIGLVAVSSDYSGKGLGQKLVNESLRLFAEKGIRHMTVVTQGTNSKAQHLYQKCGFLTRSMQLMYHWWFQDREVKQ